MRHVRYGLAGSVSGELLSLGGQVLVHDNCYELEFLITGARIVVIPPSIPDEQTMPISQHPEMVGVRFPLQRKDFR